MDKAEKNITNGRINELDFMKGILITLMVAFHLVYFGDYYPYAKQIVYTFHMPAFLVISGYLMKTERPVGKFLRTMWWIFVPYVLMECAYVVVASIVPIREHIDNLTAKVMLEKVFLHPIGPYWYLHTMMICGFTTFIVGRIFKRNIVSRLIVASLFIYLLSLSTDILSVANGLYFIGGAAIRYLKKDFRQIVVASKWAAVALVVLCIQPAFLNRTTIKGAFIVYLSMSTMLAAYPLTTGRIRTVTVFVGRNTLPIVLFSPIFTLLCKQIIPLLAFDNSRLLFLVVASATTICGSIAIGLLLDRMRLSRLLFGKDHIII